MLLQYIAFYTANSVRFLLAVICMLELGTDLYSIIIFHVERQLLPKTPPAYPTEERFSPSNKGW